MISPRVCRDEVCACIVIKDDRSPDDLEKVIQSNLRTFPSERGPMFIQSLKKWRECRGPEDPTRNSQPPQYPSIGDMNDARR